MLSVLLAGLLLLVFSGLRNDTFIIFDDPEYVTENTNIHDGITWTGLQWAFTTFTNSNWHPLTWLSHMLDIQLFGLDPSGHHFTSLLLHMASTTLLFTILYKISGSLWQSYITALLFGIHPAHVESVAWIAERKDVLSGFFFMLTLWSYERYVSKPGMRRYWPIIAFFSLGLMSKPMLITLPFLLLLLDYWPLRRLNAPGSEINPKKNSMAGLIYEKIPLFLLSIASGIITYIAQLRGGSTPALAAASHMTNIASGLISYVKYTGKLLWPQDLAIFYPRTDFPTIEIVLASLVVMILTVAAVLVRKKNPFVFVGWFWFVFSLLPVIGFIRIGSAAIADRYTYLPSIGFFILICWTAGAIPITPRFRTGIISIVTVIIISALTMLTAHQTRYWKNSFSIFEHAVQVTDNNWLAHNNLASAYLVVARKDDSLTLTKYICSKNGCPDNPYSTIYCLDSAIKETKAAIQIDPYFAPAYFNLGLAYAEFGDTKSLQNVVDRLDYIDPAMARQLRKYL